MMSAAGRISGEWNGALTGSMIERRAPCSAASATARSTAARSPLTTTWPGLLSLATAQTWSPAAAAATSRAAAMSRPSSAAIAPSPTGTAFCIAWPRRLTSRAASPTGKAPRRRQRRIFAERMAGDVGGVPADVEPGLVLEHPDHREARRHQRRLGILGQRQLAFRPLEHQPRQRLRQARRRLPRKDGGRPGRPRPAPGPCRAPAIPAREKQRRVSCAAHGARPPRVLCRPS